MGQSCSALYGTGWSLTACSCRAAMLGHSATCLESAGFLCTSCPHLMVPLTGGEKGRPVQGRRCPRNCKYPSCSAPAVFGVATGSFRTREGSGTELCASSWLVQAGYKPGDLPSQVCKAVPVGMVAFWRCLLAGCPAGTDAPGGAFSLPYAWQRAGCYCPMPATTPRCGKTACWKDA